MNTVLPKISASIPAIIPGNIPASIAAAIDKQLDEIAVAHKVNILWAIESGSRAWGFPSQDSDYDVRFIYQHTPEHYWSVFEHPDTINIPISSELDFAGWDVTKCLRLLHKGNAVLHEWLQSPVVYQQQAGIVTLQQAAAEHFQADKAYWHYFYLARKKLMDITPDSTAKAFLYGFRALLCCAWILDEGTAPPMPFATLWQRYLPAALQPLVVQLLAEKAQGDEAQVAWLPTALLDYAQQTWQALAERVEQAAPVSQRPSQAQLDCVFRALLSS